MLTSPDVRAVLSFVGEAHAVTGDDPFPAELLSALGRLVPGDIVNYCELDLGRRWVHRNTGRPEDGFPTEEGGGSYSELEAQLMGENPVCAYFASGRFDARAWSDFVTQRQLRGMRFHALFHAPDINHHLAVRLAPSPPSHTKTFLFWRARREFSERDKAVLNAIKPHLEACWRNADTRRRLAVADAETCREEGALALTQRELHVIGWVARGKTNREIAELLWLSPHTVRKHLENSFRKLGVHSRAEAVARLNGALGAQSIGSG